MCKKVQLLLLLQLAAIATLETEDDYDDYVCCIALAAERVIVAGRLACVALETKIVVVVVKIPSPIATDLVSYHLLAMIDELSSIK